MQSQKARISKRSVDAAPVPPVGEFQLWDSDLKGFFLRVHPTGRRVYALKYRMGARQRKLTIGLHGSPWTAETARQAAQEALDRVRQGDDPATAKKAARDALTVNDLIDAYLTDGPATKPAKRWSTWANDGSNLKRHVRPLLGLKVADAVTKAEAAKAIRDITDGKTAADEKTGPRGRARVSGGAGTARRTRTTAAAMFAWGVEHELIKTNPFSGVKLTAAPVRERFLGRDEAARFLDTLATLEDELAVSRTFGDALRLLLLTGARKTEVLGLTWAEVDFDHSRLTLPPERTKAGGSTGERRIVLSPPALAVLEKRRSAADAATRKADAEGGPGEVSAFVFPAARGHGHVAKGHAVGLLPAFRKVCAMAALKDVRIHDLRHSFASFAIADGASLFLIAKLLGHASARTTERYAHLAGDPLQAVADQVGRIVSPAKPTGKVAEVARIGGVRS